MRILALLMIGPVLLTSCSSIKSSHNPTSSGGRGPASVGSSAVRSAAVSAPVKAEAVLSSRLIAQTHIVQLCGLSFEQVEFKSSQGEFRHYPRFAKLPKSSLRYPVPDKIEGVNPSARLNVSNISTFEHSPQHPLLPDMPITSKGVDEKLCKELQKYHAEFQAIGPKTLRLPANAAARMQQTAAREVMQVQEALGVNNKPGRPGAKLLIVYDDLYESEANDMALLKTELGFQAELIAVSRLPGMNAGEPIPDDCQGPYLKECYHFWGDEVEGISQRAVPSLKGFHAETRMYETYERVAFIPGLIRAHLRQMKRTNPLQGVMLIGSDEVLAPFHILEAKYQNYEDDPSMPKAKLHTDLFYMLPEVPLSVHTKLHHAPLMPFMWSCQEASGKPRLDYWCDPGETRYGSSRPLADYRWPAFVPLARIMYMNEGFGGEYFENYPMSSILSVGRIPTQEHYLGIKDDSVSTYIDKVRRWHKELPAMKGSSMAVHAGSTNDSWIFLQEDTTTFKSTYGNTSKVYASEFFVPMAKCTGCVYKSGIDIFTELGNKNLSGMLFNGHGSHSALQAPFGNGNVESFFLSENGWFVDQGSLLKDVLKYPAKNTLKAVQNGGKLVGHIIANSCDLSDFNLDNGFHNMVITSNPDADQRSFSEQWLMLPDSGALNTYTNSDVGWGYSDNYYNVKFMTKVAQAWSSCGTIGDAYRFIVSDFLKGDFAGAGPWQVYNRQMLGSPMNRIARAPAHCLYNSSAESINKSSL